MAQVLRYAWPCCSAARGPVDALRVALLRCAWQHTLQQLVQHPASACFGLPSTQQPTGFGQHSNLHPLASASTSYMIGFLRHAQHPASAHFGQPSIRIPPITACTATISACLGPPSILHLPAARLRVAQVLRCTWPCCHTADGSDAELRVALMPRCTWP